MQKIFWKQPIVCHRLEECYFLQNIYLGVEVADDAVAAVTINTEFPKSQHIELRISTGILDRHQF